MVGPELFLPAGGPVALGCNVCGNKVSARITDLETINGDSFPGEKFLRTAAAMAAAEEAGVVVEEPSDE
jgi:hypothetical protein